MVALRRSLVVRSFAKVNLGLEVLGLREDGYHELRTLFQTIDLADDIEIVPGGPPGVRVRCDHPGVPAGAGNLAARAASDLRRRAGVASGVLLSIRKRIPVAGGLGGGSSNAASVLMALDRLWGLGLGLPGLLPLARRLGADVPFFLYGGTCLGLGRGDEVYPLRCQISARLVVVDLGRPLATAAVFRRLDAQLTPRQNSLNICRFVSSDLGGRASFAALTNELERAALEEAPDLARQAATVRRLLAEGGASLTAMSGSGSSFFGLFEGEQRASRARATLRAAGFEAVLARTVSLDRYQRIWSGVTSRRRAPAQRGRG